MNATPTLPAAFADLERFVPAWTLDGEGPRNAKRLASDMAALRDFYDALLPRLPDIMAHLDAHPVESAPAPERALLLLALMFMEVSPAIELFHQPDVVDAFPMDRWEILHN